MCMTVWFSKNVPLSRKVILCKNGSLGVCDVSQYLRLIFLLYAAFRAQNVRGLEDVSRYYKGLVLTLRRRNIFGLSADVRRKNCYYCSDANSLIYD